MAVTPQMSPARTREHSATARAGRLTGGGTTGNERLTAATGVLLLAPLAVIGVTLLSLRSLLSVHLFVGMLLIPPVLLKMASTGYRFMRYYTHNPTYVRKGPPQVLLRALAPLVVLSTVVVLASGVVLLFAGPSSRNTLLPIHKISFIAWAAVTALHLLGHLPGLGSTLRPDYGPRAQLTGAQLSSDVTGRAGRFLALGGALVAGVVLAVVLIPEFGPWLHSSGVFHHDH
jgi:hypothetical protein